MKSLTQDELDNHLIQINTGEGKSIALGFTAVLLAALGFRVDVVCYSRYLSNTISSSPPSCFCFSFLRCCLFVA
jgi:hypothetical protein